MNSVDFWYLLLAAYRMSEDEFGFSEDDIANVDIVIDAIHELVNNPFFLLLTCIIFCPHNYMNVQYNTNNYAFAGRRVWQAAW